MRVESLCTWLRVVATVAAFSLALNQTWADGSKAKTASSELTTKTAAVENNGKLIGTSSPSQIMIEEVRVSRTDQQTQVRVEGSGQLLYAPLCLDQPNRLVLDFSGALVHMQQKSIPSNLQPVRAVRVGQFKADVARVVIDLDDLVRYTISANGNAVTVVFEPSALVASCAAAKGEKLPTVDAEAGPRRGCPRSVQKSIHRRCRQPSRWGQPLWLRRALRRCGSSPLSQPRQDCARPQPRRPGLRLLRRPENRRARTGANLSRPLCTTITSSALKM